MIRSLRNRLVLGLGGVMVLGWLATAYFTYLDTRQLIDEVVDRHLEQTAVMLVGLLERLPDEARQPAGGVVLDGDREGPLSYRIVLAGASDGRPPERPEGWSDIARDGVSWRAFGATSARGDHVEVAALQEVGGGFAAQVAAHIMHPLAVAIPLLAALVWVAVRWGLSPLDAVAGNVARRSAADLEPLAADTAPTEITPLVSSLNALFSRIEASRERDRRFAADAAHELRTPLAAIRAHAQLAMRARTLRDCRHAVAGVLEGSERGTRVVEQLLALARLDQAQAALAPVDLTATARDAIVRIVEEGAGRADLGLAAPTEGQALVLGSGDLLQVLVRNLVDNALRHTPPEARINVGVEVCDGRVLLSVEDDGPGIPAALRERALDRFFRGGMTRSPGSGLGLSIASQVAELHGGTLGLKDGPEGRGLRAEVSLPAAR